jgi:hypothetical protein
MTKPATQLKPGDKMPDGTIYAEISPETGKPMYAMPADAPLIYTFNEAQKFAIGVNIAQKYAQGANAQKQYGYDDWHVPSLAELNVLFNNRAAIGGFDVSGSYPSGWYWSSSSFGKWDVCSQRLSDGYQFDGSRAAHSSVRLVRSRSAKSHLNEGAKP